MRCFVAVAVMMSLVWCAGSSADSGAEPASTEPPPLEQADKLIRSDEEKKIVEKLIPLLNPPVPAVCSATCTYQYYEKTPACIGCSVGTAYLKSTVSVRVKTPDECTAERLLLSCQTKHRMQGSNICSGHEIASTPVAQPETQVPQVEWNLERFEPKSGDGVLVLRYRRANTFFAVFLDSGEVQTNTFDSSKKAFGGWKTKSVLDLLAPKSLP